MTTLLLLGLVAVADLGPLELDVKMGFLCGSMDVCSSCKVLYHLAKNI